MDLFETLQTPAILWTIIVFWAGYMIGKWRSRRQDDLIGPPPGLGRGKSVGRNVGEPPQKLNHELAEWAELDPETEAAINEALSSGHKIEAIKILRRATDLGLKESKDTIDRWQ